MTDLTLVIAMAAITFASRVSFLARPRPIHQTRLARFLELFPLALFVTIAASGLLAPSGTIELTPAAAGAVGGVVGAAFTRRSLIGTVAAGAAVYWLARWLWS